MVLPITGPITDSIETPSGAQYRTYKRFRQLYRQKAPFTLPLPYTSEIEMVKVLGPYPQYTAVNSTGDSINKMHPLTRASDRASTFSLDYQYALQRAYRDFNSQIRPETAQLANLFLERKQAMQTVATRGAQLAAYAWWLKKDPLRALSIVKPRDPKAWVRMRAYVKGDNWRRFKKGSRKFSDVFLETMFGVIPTILDIQGAVAVLGGGIPPAVVTAKRTYHRTKSTGSRPTAAWGFGSVSVHALKTKVTLGATIGIDNPNLFLANQLGLINLANTAWEAVPWSFVVDYFLNVSEFLDQFTGLVGLTVQQPYYSVRYTDDVATTYFTTNGSKNLVYAGQSQTFGVYSKRTTGSLPLMKLKLNPPWTLSARRASTSIALLLQRLPR